MNQRSTNLLPHREYDRIHHAAKKLRKLACERCGSAARLEMALLPDVPDDRLLRDPRTGCLYSCEVTDYATLCTSCHRSMDLVEQRPTCRHGHVYTPENTAIRTDGSRRCLVCHRDQEKERLKDPEKRTAKNAQDREYRQRSPMTPEQKERKLELQRIRRKAIRGLK